MTDPIRNLQRWREVQGTFLRYGFDILIERTPLSTARRVLRREPPEYGDESVARRVRLMLQELGPTYVKLGQVLSSRTDLLPPEWIEELSLLQDRVPPFAGDEAIAVIEAELGQPIERLYGTFDPVPVAAASIGQVHHATLPEGTEVAVKVQRPDIHDRVQADMEIMGELARQIELRSDWGKRLGIRGIVAEFTRTLRDEMNYRTEGRNADRLRHNMAEMTGIHVPIIYWDRVSPKVLTMQRLEGIKVTDRSTLLRSGLDLTLVADLFIKAMMKQVLIDGFFHGDPHPSNIFVEPITGGVILVDLGMMGFLVDEQRRELGHMMWAFQQEDSAELVRVALTMGTPYKDVDELALRRDIDHLMHRLIGISLAQISMAELLQEELAILFEHGIRMPHELTLGIKAMVQAETIARQLNPGIRIIDLARTYASDVFWEEFAPERLGRRLAEDLREFLRVSRELPRAVEQVLQQMRTGDISVRLDVPGMEDNRPHLYIIANRLTAGLILAGMVVGSAIAMVVDPGEGWGFIRILGIAAFAISMFIGAAMVWRVLMDVYETTRRAPPRE